jgi:hypothetical protein
MKKLLILSVLLGLMALPMFASDITFGGDATFGFIGDFGDNEAETHDLTLDINAAIDDYNSLAVSLNGLENTTAGSTVGLDKALVTTDVGAWLGLPVGLVVNWGYDDPDANEFESISDYGNEEIFNFSPQNYWGVEFMLSYEFIEVEFAFDPIIADTEVGLLLAGVAVKEPIPGLNAEVYYFQGNSALGDTFDEGLLGVDAAYSTEFSGFGLDAGVGFVYDMADAADPAWSYGVGLAGSYSIATVTVGVDGNENDFLNTVSATVVVAPVDMLDIYAGMWYDLVTLEDLLEADLGVNAHIGAVELYVGYLVTEYGTDERFNSPGGTVGAVPDGGAYVKFDVNY